MSPYNNLPAKIIAQPKVVLLDIEGTICPISFVKDILFPYALEALPRVAKFQWHEPGFQAYVEAFPVEARINPESLTAHVEDLTRRDVKIACLKNLQGYLWREGYESGAFATPLFQDVLPTLEKWNDEGIKLAIYSSGSVAAQKLLVQFVECPDLTKKSSGSTSNHSSDLRSLFLGSYFDTVNAGPKTEKGSYVKIAEAMGLSSSEYQGLAFFSDSIKEVEAALDAGVTPFLVTRNGNAPLSDEDKKAWADRTVESFKQVQFSV